MLANVLPPYLTYSVECNVCCRFTGSVKLKGIIVIGGEEDTHPSVMKLYAAVFTVLDIIF